MLLAVVEGVRVAARTRPIPIPAEVAVATIGVEVEAGEIGVGGSVCHLACWAVSMADGGFQGCEVTYL